MPRNIHEAGQETISPQHNVHINDSAYAGLERLANGMSYAVSAPHYQEVGTSILPSSNEAIITQMNKLASQTAEIEQYNRDKEAGIIKAEMYPVVTSYLDNMDLHIQMLSQKYLEEHPDGKGLTQAVARELHDGLSVSFSGGDWVDSSRNLVMGGLKNLDPEISKYATQSIAHMTKNAISRALNMEYAKRKAFQIEERNTQIQNLKTEASYVSSISDMQDIATKFVGLVHSVEAESGEQSAKLFAEENTLGITARAINSLATRNPEVFLKAENEGYFKDTIHPSIIEAAKTKVIEHQTALAMREKYNQEVSIRKELYQKDKEVYKNLMNKIASDPFTVSDQEIINSLNNKTDIQTLIRYKYKALKREGEYNNTIVRADNILNGTGISSHSEQEQLDIVHTYSDESNPISIVNTANDLQNTATDKRLINRYNIEVNTCANRLLADPDDTECQTRLGQIMGAYKIAYDSNQSIVGFSNKPSDDAKKNQFMEACILLMEDRGIEPIDAQDTELQNTQEGRLRLIQYQNDVASIVVGLKDIEQNNVDVNNLGSKKPTTLDAKFKMLSATNPNFEKFYEDAEKELADTMKVSSWWHFWGKIATDKVPQWERDEIMSAFKHIMCDDCWNFEKMGCSKNEAMRMAKAKFYKKYIPTSVYGTDKDEAKSYMLYAPEIQIPNSQVPGSNAQTQLILRTATLLKGLENAINNKSLIYAGEYELSDKVRIKYINPPKIKYSEEGGYPIIEEYSRPQFKVTGADNVLNVEFQYDERNDAYMIRFISVDDEGNAIRSVPLRKKNGRIQYIKFNTQDIISATEKSYYRDIKKQNEVKNGE